MAFIDRLNQYSCDLCDEIIPKSQPVALNQGYHFCSAVCYRDWEEAKEEDRHWDEAFEHVACAGYD